MCVLVLVWRIKKQNIYLLKIIQARDFMINDFIRYLVEGSKIVDNTKFFGENEVGAWTLDDMDKDMGHKGTKYHHCHCTMCSS